jgi:catechol 2,3-dioxygenase-like lactoylglutathione lyase family enzyme
MDNLVLGKVMLFAKDLKRMVEFYRDVLGFAIIPSRFDPEEFVVLDAGNAQLCLHQIPEVISRNIEISDPPEPRSRVPVKILFIVEDVEGTRDRLIARGVQMQAIQNFPPLIYCDGNDPEGNIFQITNGNFAQN